MRNRLKERLRSAFELALDKIVDEMLKKCLECGAATEHFHHPIPKVLGGDATIPVCHDCHGLIHKLDFDGHKELIRAGMKKAAAEGRMHMISDETWEKIISMLRSGIPVSRIRKELKVGGSAITRARLMIAESDHEVSSNSEIPERDNRQRKSLVDKILKPIKTW